MAKRSCTECFHSDVCYAMGIWPERAETCTKYYATVDVAELEKVSEQIIRKKAEVTEYWKNDVKQYRASKGYSDIEHDTDNFLRGYNEAVEDVLAILDGARTDGDDGETV